MLHLPSSHIDLLLVDPDREPRDLDRKTLRGKGDKVEKKQGSLGASAEELARASKSNSRLQLYGANLELRCSEHLLLTFLQPLRLVTMLKTHAKDMRALILQKEGHHNPDLRITVQEGSGRTDHQVIVEANELLINSIMDEHSSYEYLDNERHRRERLAPDKMRFV
jgi:hypothetical protein